MRHQNDAAIRTPRRQRGELHFDAPAEFVSALRFTTLPEKPCHRRESHGDSPSGPAPPFDDGPGGPDLFQIHSRFTGVAGLQQTHQIRAEIMPEHSLRPIVSHQSDNDILTTVNTLRVPGSSANLGPGFDALGIALKIFLECRFSPSTGSPSASPAATRI